MPLQMIHLPNLPSNASVPEDVRRNNRDVFVPIAVAHEKETTFPAEVSFGQWAIESKWGTKVSGKNNYFGLTRAWSPGPVSLSPTTEFITRRELDLFAADERATAREISGAPLPLTWPGKRWVSMKRWFRDYDSINEALADKTRVLMDRNGRYGMAWAAYLATKDPVALIAGIAKAGYATAGGYDVTVTQVMRQSDVRLGVIAARADLGVVTPTAVIDA